MAPIWEPFEHTDKMDDSTAIGIKIRSPESVEGSFGRPFQPRLWIFCANKKTEVRIDLGSILDTEVRSWESDDAYGYTSGVGVRLRLDQEKPAANFGNSSTDGTSIFLRNPVAFAKKMIGRNVLLVEYAPIASARRTATFSITGFGDAVASVRKACKW